MTCVNKINSSQADFGQFYHNNKSKLKKLLSESGTLWVLERTVELFGTLGWKSLELKGPFCGDLEAETVERNADDGNLAYEASESLRDRHGHPYDILN